MDVGEKMSNEPKLFVLGVLSGKESFEVIALGCGVFSLQFESHFVTNCELAR